MSRDGVKARRRTTLLPAAAAVALCAIALPSADPPNARAECSASRTHVGVATASAGLPAPSSISCKNQGIILTSVARVSWAEVPSAHGYRVTVTRTTGGTAFVIDQTALSIDLSTGVLGGLLSGLLSPTTLTVTVQPYREAGSGGRWVSAASVSAAARAAVLPIGTTCA